MASADELRRQMKLMLPELDRRGRTHRRQEDYYTGRCPLPKAVERARVTKAYRMLMPMAEAPWGSLVVDSVEDRLEVAGIRSPEGKEAVDEAVWGAWQDNQLDAESKLAHNAALISGRAFALVQPVEGGSPEISLDSSEQMIVQYREGSRRHRVGALRRWEDDDGAVFATLYRPDGIYKFQKAKDQGDASRAGGRFKVEGDWWEPRGTTPADWQSDNPLGTIVPVVELPVNRRLKPGSFGYARGEFEHCTALIDRVNLLTFLGLVVAFWQGFPIRAVTGQRIAWEFLKDDDGNQLFEADGVTERKRARPPFTAMADEVAQFEDPDAKLTQFDAADRKLLSVLEELGQLAMITKTPRHYFPTSGGFSNLSADAIRADEGGLNAKVVAHKGSLGEGWEEVLRVSGLALPDPVYLSPRASLLWSDHEARSMAERADAAVKLKDIIPRAVLWERYLNATQEDVARWEALMANDVMSALLAEAAKPVERPLVAA